MPSRLASAALYFLHIIPRRNRCLSAGLLFLSLSWLPASAKADCPDLADFYVGADSQWESTRDRLAALLMSAF